MQSLGVFAHGSVDELSECRSDFGFLEIFIRNSSNGNNENASTHTTSKV